ncbi:hypothetical protein ACV2GS_21645, partial [Salmonella enterica subsp. enterica serovar Ordonez]
MPDDDAVAFYPACRLISGPGPISVAPSGRFAGYQPTGIIAQPNITGWAFLSMENPQLGWGFRKAFSFKSVIKTPFDLLKHLAVWQLQKFNKKSK